MQYTRNMVTGASTADLALILIDAQRGVVQQSRRHAVIASMLRVPHFLVCINKMDLVDFDQAVYDRIRDEFTAFAAKLDVTDVAFIPVSALHGDNVVTRSDRMPWYAGGSLLNHMESLFIASDRNLVDCRFPVQMVVQPTSARSEGYRGYAGQVAGGVFKPGDDVVVLPSDLTTTITSIDTYDGSLAEAFAPLAVTIRLADDIDLSRGDMICRENNRPHVGQRIDAMVCWMTDQRLTVGGRYVLKHTTRTVNAHVAEMQYRLDIDTLHREEGVDGLGLNDIGRLSLRLTSPIFFDEYRRNRTTGAFILIDAGLERDRRCGHDPRADRARSAGYRSACRDHQRHPPLPLHPATAHRLHRHPGRAARALRRREDGGQARHLGRLPARRDAGAEALLRLLRHPQSARRSRQPVLQVQDRLTRSTAAAQDQTLSAVQQQAYALVAAEDADFAHYLRRVYRRP